MALDMGALIAGAKFRGDFSERLKAVLKDVFNLMIKELPPVTSEGLTVTQPAIYYGEHMSGHRIVQTKIKEFHYLKADKNVYTSYDGRGGLVSAIRG